MFEVFEGIAQAIGFWPVVGLLVVSFVILVKSADWLVEGAIEIASHLRVPAILIGIVLVSLGTTAPELAVSVNAALSGQAELALGNAVGSVIYDDGIALPLAALFAPAAILIDRTVLRSAAIFLIIVDVVAYLLCLDGTLGRSEGLVLVGGFVVYLIYSYWEQKKKRQGGKEPEKEEMEISQRSWGLILLFFGGGLAGVLISSEWIVVATPIIAAALGVSPVIIALTVVALGTSIPEIATCVIAARKGQGSLAVGNILGADILNICWIAGASAVANPLVVKVEVINFMFPSMLVIVFTMLGLMRLDYRLGQWKGGILLALCIGYLILLYIYEPGALAHE